MGHTHSNESDGTKKYSEEVSLDEPLWLTIVPQRFTIPSSGGSVLLSFSNSHRSQCVAFKLKVQHPAEFFVSPSKAIIAPGGTTAVTVRYVARSGTDNAAPHEKMIAMWSLLGDATLPVDDDPVAAIHAGLRSTPDKRIPRIQLDCTVVPADLRDDLETDSDQPLVVRPRSFTMWCQGCSQLLLLRNRTPHAVAFKTKVTNPRHYTVNPRCDVIPPETTISVVVRTVKDPSPKPKDKVKIEYAVLDKKGEEAVVSLSAAEIGARTQGQLSCMLECHLVVRVPDDGLPFTCTFP